jgi:hypothetical protein
VIGIVLVEDGRFARASQRVSGDFDEPAVALAHDEDLVAGDAYPHTQVPPR